MAAAAPLPPPPAALRWAVLLLVSVAMFGNYYVYDSIAPLADTLRSDLGFSATQVGTLNAIYSAPNVIMVLIGGVIVDRLGARLATLAFTAICLAGAALTAASGAFETMALGRLIFGLGAESMIVAVTTALGQWFKARELGFAFGLNLSVARAGSYAADVSPVWASGAYAAGWRGPLLVAVGFAALALAAAAAYWLAERRAQARYALGLPQPADRIVWSDLWQFDRSYWYLVGLCVTFYSVIFPFRSTFAIEYFQNAHGLSLADAGTMNSYVFLAAIVVTPLFGLMVDRLGRRSVAMFAGSLLLLATFPTLLFTDWSLWVTTALIGVAFSLVPAVLWPSVPYLVEAHRLGTAYGLMTMLQNIGLTVCNLAAGALNDLGGASAANPAGYDGMLWMFAVLSLAALVFAWLLRRREAGPHGHGLETIRA
ncbi:MAG TPA: MFS transporter [Vicinamibacterales bacterium]|nr:MFS transporter [Vicinamibacterales bacterium]